MIGELLIVLLLIVLLPSSCRRGWRWEAEGLSRCRRSSASVGPLLAGAGPVISH